MPTDDMAGTLALLYPKREEGAGVVNGDVVIPAAEELVFKRDLTTTAPIGNVELDESGKATIEAYGKTVGEVWDAIFVEEKLPEITQPFVTLNSPTAKIYEVGTAVVPRYSAVLNPGNYEYGPGTGVIVNVWKISDTGGNISADSAGSFPEIVVGDNTSYSITATASHSGGEIPVTNTGNEYADGAILAGDKTAISGRITGYRKSFYGTTKDKSSLNSEVIRGLSGSSGKALSNGSTFDISIPVGAMRVVIAYPATLRDLTSVKDVNGMNAEISSGFSKTSISVEGANGYTEIAYKVYTLEYATANDAANTYKVQI